MSYSKVHESSKHAGHLIDLFCWHGAPVNHNSTHKVEILVNTGYVVGFCPSRFQPSWVAYRVAHSDRDVDYDRPHLYYADTRVEEAVRLEGTIFGQGYHVGHMAPNEAINRQFGRLSQMETFFMTNMSPQLGSLNTGVWLKLERAILNIDNTRGQKDHIWAIIGPVFSDNPDTIRHSNKNVPIPESYFCITIDPHTYPYNSLSKVELLCMKIPQDADRYTSPLDYLVSLADIEAATKLSFFPGWARPRAGPDTNTPLNTIQKPINHRLFIALQNNG